MTSFRLSKKNILRSPIKTAEPLLGHHPNFVGIRFTTGHTGRNMVNKQNKTSVTCLLPNKNQATVKSDSVVCQFSEYFLDLEGMPNHSLIESGTPPDLLLVCNAIIISRSTNLSVLKDYLPQLLENEHTVSCSHYKRLIRSGGVPLFNISDSANSKLIDCILRMIYKTLSERVRAALRKYLILE